MKAIDEFIAAFDAVLHAEGVGTFALAGQSYGGMLAQAYLAHRREAVEGSPTTSRPSAPHQRKEEGQ